jgi:hypothetical protein
MPTTEEIDALTQRIVILDLAISELEHRAALQPLHPIAGSILDRLAKVEHAQNVDRITLMDQANHVTALRVFHLHSRNEAGLSFDGTDRT